MQISDCRVNTGQFIDVVDVLPTNSLDVLLCDCGGLHIVGRVQAVIFVRMIEEESVRVFILDIIHQGYMPEFGLQASPPFENCRH